MRALFCAAGVPNDVSSEGVEKRCARASLHLQKNKDRAKARFFCYNADLMYISLLAFLFVFSSVVCNLFAATEMNQSRRLLTELRGGDYAHAGDEAAVKMVASKVLKLSPDVKKGPTLDVGCGFGGTANYLYRSHFQSIYGIDVDEAAIDYAKKRYPKIHFRIANAAQITDVFDSDFFSFLYMFNVCYAIEDKQALLKELFTVAKPGALLVIFDYTSKNSSSQMKDLANKPMYPIVIKQLTEECKQTDWTVLKIDDVSSDFITWYQDLLNKLDKNREALSQKFSQADIERVASTFSTLLDQLKSKELGGAVIYLQRQ